MALSSLHQVSGSAPSWTYAVSKAMKFKSARLVPLQDQEVNQSTTKSGNSSNLLHPWVKWAGTMPGGILGGMSSREDGRPSRCQRLPLALRIVPSFLGG